MRRSSRSRDRPRVAAQGGADPAAFSLRSRVAAVGSPYGFSWPRYLDGSQDVADQSIGCDPVGLSLEAQDQAVPESGQRDRLQVLASDVEPILEQRAHLGAGDQRL